MSGSAVQPAFDGEPSDRRRFISMFEAAAVRGSIAQHCSAKTAFTAGACTDTCFLLLV